MTNSTAENSFLVHRPGFNEKMFFFISGIVTSVPITFFANLFTDSLCIVLPILYAQICSVAIFTPFIEEFAKAYPLFYRHGESIRSLFTLGFLVGLGFGFAEFILYVFVYNVPFFVRLPGIFFHASNTALVAYGIRTAKPWPYYLIAVGLHFAVNFAAIVPSLWILAPLSFFSSYYLAWNIYKRTLELPEEIIV